MDEASYISLQEKGAFEMQIRKQFVYEFSHNSTLELLLYQNLWKGERLQKLRLGDTARLREGNMYRMEGREYTLAMIMIMIIFWIV